MKLKISCFLLFLICFTLVATGCGRDNVTPYNVTFKNGTYLGSKNYTITIVYAEDKRIRDKYTDVLVKCDKPTNLKITKELGSTWNIPLQEVDTWQSLTKLIDQNLSFATFSTVETTTYIINSSEKCKLSFKVIGGDKQGNELQNTFDVSNVFNLSVKYV